jgi:transcriptional regulator with XRE-family HTH domain
MKQHRDIIIEIWVKIREISTRLGLSIRELAERVGISYLTMQRIETDRISPSVLVLANIGPSQLPAIRLLVGNKTGSGARKD